MNQTIRDSITSLLAGFLMGLGLLISTMVDPERVLGFLDIFGNWDPTLMMVMVGGLAVYLPLYFLLIKGKEKTMFNADCDLPKSTKVDKPLVIGAVLFGLGWGLSGICPGPALVNLSGGTTEIFVFVITMFVGMFFGSMIANKKKPE